MKFSCNMSRKQKKVLIRILLAALMTAVLAFMPVQGALRLVLFLIPYLTVAYDILLRAGKGIWNRQLLDENFLMAIATVGALVLGAMNGGDYLEAVAVMLFYQTGELFQSYAVGKSRRSIGALMDIRPDYANIEENGQLVQTDPDEIAVDTEIVVCPGERVPIDGIVIQGHSSLDTVALTGESLPRDVGPGDEIYSGCINLSGLLKLRTTKPFDQSTVSRILELVENASSNKSRSEKFISRFARIYTPAVCAAALALAIAPPGGCLLLGQAPDWTQWLYRALTFLVASCPCALVISIPLSFFAGIGCAGKAGILVKGSNYLEALSRVDTVVFDKTGTLTQGVFEVSHIHAQGITEQQLLEFAALAESASSHPISKSLQRAWGQQPDHSRVSDIQEYSGKGVTALVDGHTVAAGNEALMSLLEIRFTPCEQPGSIVHVALDSRWIGYILISDTVKPSATATIAALKAAGVTNCVMLTGDREAAAAQIADSLGITRYHSQLLPADKVTKVELLLSEQKHGGKLAFVGDGINDAPVLTRADIGIAMGAMGADAAIEAADVVLMDDDPSKIPLAIRISRKTLSIVGQNIWFAIAVKLLSLVLVAVGLAGMWLAIFADVGVMVLAVLNAIRAMRI